MPLGLLGTRQTVLLRRPMFLNRRTRQDQDKSFSLVPTLHEVVWRTSSRGSGFHLRLPARQDCEASPIADRPRLPTARRAAALREEMPSEGLRELALSATM